MSLCAQHSSRPFAERSLREPLPPLFYSFFFFFGTIFEMHSQLSSANLFALAFAELQDHAGSPGGARLPHYRRLLKLPRTMPECYSSSSLSLSLSLTYFISFFGGFFYICFGFVLTLYLSPSPRRATARRSQRDQPPRSRPIAPCTTAHK